MPEVFNAETGPLDIAYGKPHHTPLTLQAFPNGGSVTIELWDPVAGVFYLPAEPLHTITQDIPITMERIGKPRTRVSVIGTGYVVVDGEIWK